MIGLPVWILWVHILSAAVWIGGAAGQLENLHVAYTTDAGRRLHFLTSRAMEVLVLTGMLNIIIRAVAFNASFSAAFFAMLSVKVALFAVMAGLQIWMGLGWRQNEQGGPGEGSSRFPLARLRGCLIVQLLSGAVAVLLGLGVRAV
jgi:hypothetical protein